MDHRDLLFSFRLVHIPAAHHTGADGLSHCLLSDEDPPEEDDFEDWLDNSYSFSITVAHALPAMVLFFLFLFLPLTFAFVLTTVAMLYKPGCAISAADTSLV